MRQWGRRLGLYGTVLRRPGVLAPAIGTVLASLPIGMLSLALLLLQQHSGRNLSIAGTVVAVFGFGTGLGIVSQGRMIDWFGPRRVLLIAATIQAAALTSVALVGRTPVPAAVVAALAFLAGLAEPQAGSALRSMWPSLVTADESPTASALSSILFEVPVAVGPLLLSLIIRVSSVEAVILMAAGLSLTGSLLISTSKGLRSWRRAPDRKRGVLGPLAVRQVRLTTLVMAAQGVGIGLLQVSCAAFFARRSTPSDSGLLYALLSLGSLIGTTLYGAWAGPTAGWKQLRVFLSLLAATLVGAAFAPEATTLALFVCAAGLQIGPVSVRCFTDADRNAPPGRLAATSTTLIAAGLAATSAGTAAAGWLIDASGTTAALLTAAAFPLAAALLLIRQNDAGPASTALFLSAASIGSRRDDG